jgi:hypothetical protein
MTKEENKAVFDSIRVERQDHVSPYEAGVRVSFEIPGTGSFAKWVPIKECQWTADKPYLKTDEESEARDLASHFSPML